MKKRNVLALILTVLMAAALMACNKNDTGRQTDKNTLQSSSKESQTEKNSQAVSEKESTSSAEKETESKTEAVTKEEQTVPPKTDDDLPYYIKVNRAANCITVYKKDEKGGYNVPVIAFACSVGDYDPTNPNSEPTPLGVFNLSDKYEWGLMVDGSYGRYAYRICSDILFHSVPYLGNRVKYGLETDQYNKLGSPASLGCVRLCVRDAKWIFDNCPKGTVVEIYDDETNPGPLGKPESIKIPEDSPYAGWDPTEDDPDNPWNNYSAKINGAKDITVKKGSTVNFFDGVTATDKCGNDISEKIVLSGVYDIDKAGKYELTYSVTDATGSSDEVKITMTVEEK